LYIVISRIRTLTRFLTIHLNTMKKSILRSIQPILFIILGLAFSLTAAAQTTIGTLTHDGLDRSYRIHLPPNFNNSESLPLVFNIHGFGSNAIQQEFYSGMNAVSDTARFILCYPDGTDENGTGRSWNVGWSGGSTADDIGFIEAMIEEFATLYNVNTNRVYSCGMSNGGFMSYHLACNIPDKIAAIASVTGSMVPGSFDDCQPDIARPILEIHGTADQTVPYNGTAMIAAPIEAVVAHWVTINDCSITTDTTIIPDINTDDNSTAIRIDYNNCEEDKIVSLIKIDNGAHTWPGSAVVIGTTNQDFNASSTVWNFFSRFSLNNQSTATEEIAIADKIIALFPNPATDFLQISYTAGNLPTGIVKYEVFGIDGKKYINGTLDNAQTSISIDLLPKGIYLFRIIGEKSSQQKFIKQ